MKTQSIGLYQPDDALVSRIPGGTEALATYIKQLQKHLADHYVGVPATSRALVVALTPRAAGFWILAPTGVAPEFAQLQPILEGLPRPEVVGGPIAFAILCNLGEPFPEDSGLPIPAEWLDVAQSAGKPVQVDDILTTLLG